MKQKTSGEAIPGIHLMVPDSLRRMGSLSGVHPTVIYPKGLVFFWISLIFILLPCIQLKGQEIPTALLDTIRFQSPGNASGEYLVSNSLTKTIVFQPSDFKRCKGDHFTIGGETGRHLLTLFTGLETGAEKEVNWLLSGRINTDDPELNWKVDIYCPGFISKSKVRVRNDDGSVSTENNKIVEAYWEESVGYIIQESDTIGIFNVINYPRNTPHLEQWAWEVFPQPLMLKGNKAMKITKKEFALRGELYGQQILIIYNAENNRMYLYHETNLKGIFEPEHKNLTAKKKVIERPLLQVDSTLNEDFRSDLLLLSMLGQWFLLSSKDLH